jgi:hypothetical protein
MVDKDDDERDTGGRDDIPLSQVVQPIYLDPKDTRHPRSKEGDPPQLHLTGVEHDNPNGVSRVSQCSLRVS